MSFSRGSKCNSLDLIIPENVVKVIRYDCIRSKGTGCCLSFSVASTTAGKSTQSVKITTKVLPQYPQPTKAIWGIIQTIHTLHPLTIPGFACTKSTDFSSPSSRENWVPNPVIFRFFNICPGLHQISNMKRFMINFGFFARSRFQAFSMIVFRETGFRPPPRLIISYPTS